MKHTFKILLSLSVLACTTIRKPGEASTQKTENIMADTLAYFSATGVEPFWGLRISDAGIEYSYLKESIEKVTLPHREPIKAMDANVKLYATESYQGQLRTEIFQKNCVNEMSGEEFPYQVKLSVKLKNETEARTLNGCGRYHTDYRLHDIWALEKLNGKAALPGDFQRELPNMEINAGQNIFMGYAGCNTMRGKIFFEKGLLRFEKTATTLMACPGANKESEFLQALAATTTYRIGNNRLFLSNPDKETLVFKKVD